MKVASWHSHVIVGASFAALLLSACHATVSEQAVDVAPDETVLASPGTQAVIDTHADIADPLVLAPPPPPAPPPIDDNPQQVVGLVPNQVADLLGKPGFVRKEAGAEIWQYRQPECVLDLFLYVDALKAQRVVHYELRGTTPGARLDIASGRDCFLQILSRNSAV